MITEDYVSFETAKLLKEKGFNEECRAFWKDWDGQTMLCHCSRNHVFEWCHNSMLEEYYNNNEETNIAAPTLQMTMKWLREEYGIHILFDLSAWETYDWYYVYKGNRYHYDEREFDHNTYEEACESAIKFCLENLI